MHEKHSGRHGIKAPRLPERVLFRAAHPYKNSHPSLLLCCTEAALAERRPRRDRALQFRSGGFQLSTVQTVSERRTKLGAAAFFCFSELLQSFLSMVTLESNPTWELSRSLKDNSTPIICFQLSRFIRNLMLKILQYP